METAREFNKRGFSVLLMAFSAVVVWGGAFKSLGVLLPALTDQFTDYTWLTGIAVSIMGVTADIAGPALGITIVLSKVALGCHFNKRYSLASGISHTGQVISLLACAPMMQLFLDTYGWRGASLLLAGVCFHPVICAVLVRENKTRYEIPPNQSDVHETNSNESTSDKSYCAHAVSTMDLGVLLRFNFWVVCSILFGLRFVNTAWFLFYVSHLQAKGLTPQIATGICSAAGVGYFLGCILFASFVDRGLLKCSSAVLVSSLGLALSLVVDPWLEDAVAMAFANVFFGMSTSALYSLSDVLTKELLGVGRLTSAFSWIGAVCVLGSALAGFMPDWVYDTTGNFDTAFIVLSITPVVAAIPLLIGRIWKQLC
ncbi:monocarboxylate transporter 12-like isoform X2 [Acanthaster planci]|uniref:Monocarboxylate transporter 12-like isoform X2 n=1 Tax=Acanthaster planci TaxID=133434 RepID=A0A8B7XH25_ACAPL|nr:monocarboxylate transporter 12-like isoform X2 [Acanthaster planci]